ncbi:hypothetical protein PMAYCL1PPCAC_04553, partial [Pristionchus mayeri]
MVDQSKRSLRKSSISSSTVRVTSCCTGLCQISFVAGFFAFSSGCLQLLVEGADSATCSSFSSPPSSSIFFFIFFSL